MESITATGLSTVYEPRISPPAVDIIFVHGLKGHPYKTWTSSQEHKHQIKGHTYSTDEKPAKSLKGLHEAISRLRSRLNGRGCLESGEAEDFLPSSMLGEGSDGGKAKTFWPGDLLPTDCPEARILTFGYDTKISKYMSGPTNKNSIYSHAKDFMFALSRQRPLGRPLIFIAHSLGGILVKEMLATSSYSLLKELTNIVESTAAVIFLGTPHRGSPELSSLGEWARSVLSILMMDTTSVILDALGLKTTDLERAQEAFSSIWQQYDFRVKTFQEGLGLTGINLGVFGNKVVPDFSSSLGDQRENLETLQANHMEMCRFNGVQDPNYVKVAGELRSIYLSIMNVHDETQAPISQSQPPYELTNLEKACLKSFWFPLLHTRRQNIAASAPQTCSWLFKQQIWQEWVSDSNWEHHHGLLWLKGKPASGKSTLMKEALQRVALAQNESDACIASFFFDAKGDELERTASGLFRSLLYQILPHFPECLRHIAQLVKETRAVDRQMSTLDASSEDSTFVWPESDVKSFFESIFSHKKINKRIIIFVDALDESDEPRIQAHFWRQFTQLREGVNFRPGVLSICLSSRHFPHITLNHCLQVVMEDHNSQDISTYVSQKFDLHLESTELPWSETLKAIVIEKSIGVFLWAVLVVDGLLRNLDQGKGPNFLFNYVEQVPQELASLFVQIIESLRPEERQLSVRVFQWALLAPPLRLHEWHHILAFIKEPPPTSLRQWQDSEDFTETDLQLERQIKSLSGGLLEVSGSQASSQARFDQGDAVSVIPGAGSLDMDQGDSRVIQVIHESVREFFMQEVNGGFALLDTSLVLNAKGSGHISIMNTCLNYLFINELEPLIQARNADVEFAQRHLPPRNLSQHFAAEVVPLPKRETLSPSYGPKVRGDKPSVGRIPPGIYNDVTAIDIFEWINRCCVSHEPVSKQGSTIISLSREPSPAPSEWLLYYPALLSYVTSSLFVHFRRAQATGIDVKPMLNRLQHDGAWKRWVILREDLPQDITLCEYLTTGKRDKERDFEENEIPQIRKHTKLIDSTTWIKGSRSIASFGSASSHVGSQDDDSYNEVLYFAYGTDMSTEEMHMICPSSTPVTIACLSGWKWFINSQGRANVARVPLVNSDNQGSASTTEVKDSEEAIKDKVFGLLYLLRLPDEEMLDLEKNVPEDYQKFQTDVVCVGGAHKSLREVKALIYIDEMPGETGVADKEYIRRLNAATKDVVENWGMDEQYIEHSIKPFCV